MTPDLDDDREARIIVAAISIASDIDLDDEDDVVRALFAQRFSSADFDDILDDVIAMARRNRMENRQ